MSFLTPDHLVKELNLKPGDRVADVGCGSGAYTLSLAKDVGEIGHVYVIDVNREILHTLTNTLERRGIMNVDTVWADIEKGIPVGPYSLDAVVLSNVLFQLEDIDSALSHISKIIKPEGQLLVVDWSQSHGGIGPHPAHVVNEARAEELVTKHNFRVLKRLGAGDYHYAFIAISL